MKRIIALALTLLLAAPASAEVVYRRRNAVTSMTIADITSATGKLKTSGGSMALKCACGASTPGAATDITFSDCEATTTATANTGDGAGTWDLAIAALDTDGEVCYILITTAAAEADHLIEIRTADYLSHWNVNSQTATQPAVSLTGNTTGAGLSATGGASNGRGAHFIGVGTGQGIKAESAGGAGVTFAGGDTSAGFQVAGASTGAGFQATGGSNGPGISATGQSTAAGLSATGGATSGNGASFIGGGTGSGSYHYSAGGVGSYILSGAAQGLRVGGSSYGMTVTGTGAYGAVNLTPGTTATSVITCTGNNCTSQVVNAARKW